MLGCLEGREDGWVHLDRHVLVLDDPLVPPIDLAVDPLLEGRANLGVDDIGDAGKKLVKRS